MKLNATQIEQLYSFTQAHYVKYYDLQSELVDHLANDIETQWEVESNIDFETALNIAFKKFGVFGFEDVVLEKTKSLQKKYNKWVWQNLISFFKIPQIISTLVGMYFVFKLLVLGTENEIYTYIIMGGLIISSIIFIIINYVNYYKLNKNPVWLMENIIYNNNFNFSLLVLNLNIQLFLNISPTSNLYLMMLMSFLIVISILINYITLIKIPKNAKYYLLETYPYFLA
ncbi:MAG: hypothetical protein ACOVQ2_01610 [Flavobacterium sp.]